MIPKRKPFRGGAFTGRLPDAVRATVTLNKVLYSFYENAGEEPDDDIPIHRFIIGAGINGRHFTTINLTSMSMEELELLQEIFLFAIDQAKESAIALDQRAAEAVEKGEVLYERSYRRVSPVLYRERRVGADGKGIPVGPERFAEIMPVPGGEPLGAGNNSEDVSDGQPEPLVAADDQTEG